MADYEASPYGIACTLRVVYFRNSQKSFRGQKEVGREFLRAFRVRYPASMYKTGCLALPERGKEEEESVPFKHTEVIAVCSYLCFLLTKTDVL